MGICVPGGQKSNSDVISQVVSTLFLKSPWPGLPEEAWSAGQRTLGNNLFSASPPTMLQSTDPCLAFCGGSGD